MVPGRAILLSLLPLAAALALVPAAAAATITVGPSANGSTRELLSGDTLVVRLPGNPTTGYRWTVTARPSALRALGSTYLAPAKGLPGQGGTYVFRFRARAGAGTLRLAYARSFEKGKPPIRTFRLAVLVR